MEHDALDFLNGPTEAETVTPAAPATPEVGAEGVTAAAPTEAVKEPATGATPVAPVVATPAAPEGEEGGAKTVPLATFLDMRDKAKTLEARVKELEPPEGITPPDPVKEPGKYLEYRENMIHLTIMNERMNFSEKSAIKEHGKELVEKARTWATTRFAADTAYEDRIMREADPYETVVADFQRHQLEEEVLSDPATVEEFRRWKAEKANGGTPTADTGKATPDAQPAKAAATGKPVAQPQRAAPAQDEPLPKTIADAPTSGGTQTVPVGSGQAFDSLFATG
jgi:hypothetical protein